MNICIYSKNQYGDFNSREHIIPAFLGGIKKLPKGYVEDSINSKFSGSIEDYFSHESRVAFIRNIKGPGKRGKPSFVSRPMVAFNKHGFPLLVSGNPDGVEVIPQIILKHCIVNYSMCEIEISSKMSINKSKLHLINDFINADLTTKSTFIENPYSDENLFLITMKNDKWYISGKTRKTIKNLRTIIEYANPGKLLNENEMICDEEMGVSKLITYENDELRVIAKILFNLLALYKGQKFVLLNAFDLIRNYVLTSDNYDKIKLNIIDGVFDDKCIKEENNIADDSHIVAIISKNGIIYGIVQLYGTIIYSLEIAEIDTDEFFIIFYCDWHTKNEKLLNMDVNDISRIIKSHTVKFRAYNLDNVLQSQTLFDKQITESNIELLRELKEKLLQKSLVLTFSYNSKEVGFYSKISIGKEIIDFFINTNKRNSVFNGLLEEGLRYVLLCLEARCYAAPKDSNAEGEREIANYLNLISTFSYVDAIMKNEDDILDVIYNQRFSYLTGKLLNHIKNEDLNEFLILSLSIQISIICLYNYDYQKQFKIVIADLSSEMIPMIEKIVILMKKRFSQDNYDKKAALKLLISELNIENHIKIVDF